MLYHRGWNRAVEAAGASLHSSLLARHSDDGGYVVNLDWQVVELLHEARHLQQMSLDVDDAALALCRQHAHITSTRDSCVHARQSFLSCGNYQRPIQQYVLCG